jgi:parallel beta-helix repeat protein
VRTQWGNTAWTIQNNNFHHTGSEASLHLQASNSTVQNNSFGPMLTTVTVNGNYGLDILGNHNEVRGNTFFGHRDNGIILEQWYCSTSSACNDTAQYNTIENNRFFSEPGGIDVYGADNNVFKNNLFYNSANAVAFIQGGRAGANPSYSEQQPTNNLFANNTAYNISSIAVYFDSSAAGNVIQNNIFSSAKLAFWNPSNNSRNPISTNLYDNTGVYTMDSNPLTGSAQFVNAGAQNFYLQSGSAAIDRGLTISQVPVDMVGTARPKGAAYDIGAYEFVH